MSPPVPANCAHLAGAGGQGVPGTPQLRHSPSHAFRSQALAPHRRPSGPHHMVHPSGPRGVVRGHRPLRLPRPLPGRRVPRRSLAVLWCRRCWRPAARSCCAPRSTTAAPWSRTAPPRACRRRCAAACTTRSSRSAPPGSAPSAPAASCCRWSMASSNCRPSSASTCRRWRSPGRRPVAIFAFIAFWDVPVAAVMLAAALFTLFLPATVHRNAPAGRRARPATRVQVVRRGVPRRGAGPADPEGVRPEQGLRRDAGGQGAGAVGRARSGCWR